MQRDKRKHLGGMWEATAGGSALQGEDSLSCARRELREETGIISGELIENGRVLHYSHKTYYVDYLCITNADKSSVVLQEGETMSFKWVTASALRKTPRNELASMRQIFFI